MKLEDFLKLKYDYDSTIKDNIKTYIEQWRSWYVGNVKSFHNYFVWNGREKVSQKRYTMNMAKKVSEDWSDILYRQSREIHSLRLKGPLDPRNIYSRG